MTTVSRLQLHRLRAMYLLIAVGLGLQVWPGFLAGNQSWELMEGVLVCMLVAFR